MTIHLSEAAHKELVPVLGDDYFVSVGKRNIKGKGTLQTYLAKVKELWKCLPALQCVSRCTVSEASTLSHWPVLGTSWVTHVGSSLQCV